MCDPQHRAGGDGGEGSGLPGRHLAHPERRGWALHSRRSYGAVRRIRVRSGDASASGAEGAADRGCVYYESIVVIDGEWFGPEGLDLGLSLAIVSLWRVWNCWNRLRNWPEGVGRRIARSQRRGVSTCVGGDDIYDLFYWANKIRIQFIGRDVKFCHRRGQSRGVQRRLQILHQSAHHDGPAKEQSQADR